MSESKLSLLIQARDRASKALNSVRDSVNNLADKVSNTGASAFNRLNGAISSLGAVAATAGVTGVAALVAGITALSVQGVKAYANMQQMRAALETAFGGNIELAKAAEKQITQFAAKTPYAVGEVMNAFIKLKNMGLDPSEEALTAYGDTASSMGKSLNDMVEAVADAATGEFERLKEFGIRASSQGDKVSFTFKGVTKTVGKNSQEIQKYLKELGKTNFAGGMERQSKTLSGMWSTFVDTINMKLADFIEKSKIGDILTEGLGKAISFIEKVDISPFVDGIKKISYAVAEIIEIFQTGQVESGDGLFAFFSHEQIDVIINLINSVKQAFTDLSTYFTQTIFPTLQPLFNAFSDFFVKLQPVVERVMKAVTEVIAIAMPLIQQYFREVVPIIESAVKRITDEILPLIIPIIDQIVEVFRLIQPYLQPVLTWLVSTFSNVVNTIITVFKGLLQFVGGFLDVLIGLFSGNGDRIRQGFLGMFNGLATAVAGIFKGIGNAIINNINYTSDQINKVLEKTGGGMRVPRLSNFAKGGSIANEGLVRVGENGAEYIDTRAMRVLSKSQTSALDNSRGSETAKSIKIEIDMKGMPPVLDRQSSLEFVRNIKRELIQELRFEL